MASDPSPKLISGTVYVPLRGVLETLGAQVNYVAAQDRIDITQADQTYSLRPGKEGAVAGTKLVPLAPSKVIDGRAFVPLRALAQLFGYEVAWQNQTRTVAISSKSGLALGPTDHRAALAKAGNVGITVDFTQFAPEELPTLLAQAKATGATLLKFRFDWDELEPTQGAAFNWPVYDRIVKSAREEGFTIVGVLGHTAQWASVSMTGDARVKRLSPPRPDAYTAWSNYVTRVVGRYKNDVQAWQVWENPDAANFFSVARTYRQLASLAVDAARKSDAKSIVHLAEPGAVSLTFLADLNKNGLTPRVDGVAVYPVAGYQPNTLETPEAFLRPYATLRSDLVLKDGKNRDYWIGGVSFPDLGDPNKPDFTEQAQADFAVRALALGLAASDGKAFYDVLRDSPTRPTGRGLLRADGTPRLVNGGVTALTKAIGNLPFKGVLRADDSAVVLLFDNKAQGAVVAWSPRGRGKLNLSALGLPADSPDVASVSVRPDSVLYNSAGQGRPAPDGTLSLTTSPLVITNVGGETAKAAQVQTASLQLQNPPRFNGATSASVQLGEKGEEAGINFRKYARFGGETQKFYSNDAKQGLTTTPPVSALDPASGRPFVYLDVDDDFMYNLPNSPVTVTVEVKRPPIPGSTIITTTSGFRVEYDGVKTTKWVVVEPGEGWTTLTFDLPDAQFTNAGGYDLLLNAGGSKMPLTFGKVTVSKTPLTAIAQNP